MVVLRDGCTHPRMLQSLFHIFSVLSFFFQCNMVNFSIFARLVYSSFIPQPLFSVWQNYVR